MKFPESENIQELTMDKNLTSYCGLYCSDCIPSDAELFSIIDSLDTKLQDIQFEYYAELKSESNEHFKDYSLFLTILHQVQKLQCSAPCRLEGGKSRCMIRECARGKELSGCWQCMERKECALLDRLRIVHPHIDYHLDLIEEMGPVTWFEKRKEHYRWLVPDDHR
jgi:hypothetical protein